MELAKAGGSGGRADGFAAASASSSLFWGESRVRAQQLAFLRAAQHGVERMVKTEGVTRDQAVDALVSRLGSVAAASAAASGEEPAPALAAGVDSVEVRVSLVLG